MEMINTILTVALVVGLALGAVAWVRSYFKREVAEVDEPTMVDEQAGPSELAEAPDAASTGLDRTLDQVDDELSRYADPPLRALAAANYLVDLAHRDRVRMTPMMLQKMLYLADGHHLARAGRPLFPEQIEAWEHGPVCPVVYREFRRYGASPIKDKVRMLEAGEQHGYPVWRWTMPGVSGAIPSTREAAAVIDEAWAAYGHLDGPRLMALVHAPGSPLQDVDSEERAHRSIDPQAMRAYFLTRIRQGHG